LIALLAAWRVFESTSEPSAAFAARSIHDILNRAEQLGQQEAIAATIGENDQRLLSRFLSR